MTTLYLRTFINENIILYHMIVIGGRSSHTDLLSMDTNIRPVRAAHEGYGTRVLETGWQHSGKSQAADD